MTYKEETYVLDTLKELKEKIRDMPLEQLVRETHENNIMLREIIKYLNKEIAYANTENNNDFIRNILANLISSRLEIKNAFNKRK